MYKEATSRSTSSTLAASLTRDQVVHDEAVHVRPLHMQVIKFLHPLIFRDFIGFLCITHSDLFLQEKNISQISEDHGNERYRVGNTLWHCNRAGR